MTDNVTMTITSPGVKEGYNIDTVVAKVKHDYIHFESEDGKPLKKRKDAWEKKKYSEHIKGHIDWLRCLHPTARFAEIDKILGV